MADLFGNPDALETQPALAVAIDLFAAAAEAIAFEGSFSLRCDDCGAVDSECFCIGATASRIPSEGSRPLSQVATELRQPTPEALPADGLFVVGSTTWGFDDAGRYRVQRKEGEAKVRRA